MSAFKNISSELKTYFSSHRVFKLLLPLDVAFLFGGIGLIILSAYVNTSDIIYALAYYGFFLGLLLTYANFREKFLCIGLLAYSINSLVEVFYHGFGRYYSYFDAFSLITFLIAGALGFILLKRAYPGIFTSSGGTGSSPKNTSHKA